MPIYSDLIEVKSPLIRSLHTWWTSSRGPCGLPDRASFEPSDHKALLANMMICDYEPKPFRVRYRLVGTRVTAITGFEFTGRYLDEVLGPNATEPWLDYYATVASSRAPLVGSVTEPTTIGVEFTYEFGIFPVTRGGAEVEQFLSIEDYFGAKLISTVLQPWPPSKA